MHGVESFFHHNTGDFDTGYVILNVRSYCLSQRFQTDATPDKRNSHIIDQHKLDPLSFLKKHCLDLVQLLSSV